jgi:hypothetical protein
MAETVLNYSGAARCRFVGFTHIHPPMAQVPIATRDTLSGVPGMAASSMLISSRLELGECFAALFAGAFASRFGKRVVALYADLFDFEHGEESGGALGFDAVLRDNAKTQDRDNLKCRVCLFLAVAKLTSAHIGHRGDSAGRWVMLSRIDVVDGAVRVAVIESDKAFHLLLRITNQARAASIS